MTTLDLAVPSQLLTALTPDLVLMVGTMVVMLYAAWRPDSIEHQRSVGWASIVVTLATMGTVIWFARAGYTAAPGVIAVDNFRWWSDLIFLVGTLLTIALSMDYNERETITAPETHVLVLFATAGMMLLAAARDLMIVFLGVELMSVSVYVLAGLNRRSARAAEGALKYFLLGAFSTAFMLYGIALVYGATGSTNLGVIAERIVAHALTGSRLLAIGVALLLIGFGFKVAAAPFHMWAPDVYEGAPTPVTGYMAAAVKAAAFSAFFRIWIEAFPDMFRHWHLALWWLAMITMVVGNVVALRQRNIKRLLAYSSIAHAGYVLVALVVGTPGNVMGAGAFLFYLMAYTLATVGAFGVVVALGTAGERNLQVDDYAGLWQVRPWIAVAMAVFMLALLGFPVFGGVGFFAKWYVLQAALQAPSPQTRLAIGLVLTSVVSAGYYLYVVMVMFMKPRPTDAPAPLPVGGLTRIVILGTAVLVLVLGVAPSPLIRWARSGVPSVAPQSPPGAGATAVAIPGR